MIRINLEVGSALTDSDRKNDCVKLTVINYEKESTCDVTARFPFLQNVDTIEFESFLYWISYSFNQCYKNTITGNGIQYIEPISKQIKEKYFSGKF